MVPQFKLAINVFCVVKTMRVIFFHIVLLFYNILFIFKHNNKNVNNKNNYFFLSGINSLN